MSPAKTIETMADHLTGCVGNGSELVNDAAVFGLLNAIAIKLSGYRLLKLTDSDGRVVGFTSDKKPVSEILPVTDPADSQSAPDLTPAPECGNMAAP